MGWIYTRAQRSDRTGLFEQWCAVRMLTVILAAMTKSCAHPFPPAQSAAMASIGVLVSDNVQQLLLFGGVHASCCIVLVWVRPFSNR